MIVCLKELALKSPPGWEQRIPAHPTRFLASAPGREPSMVSVVTLVFWMACLAVGAAGLWLKYPMPQEPAPSTPPLEVRMLDVELRSEEKMVEAAPDSDVAELPNDLNEPPSLLPLTEAPTVPEMAIPTTNATAAPVAKESVRVRSSEPIARPTFQRPVAEAQPQPKRLVFGEGEGIQPAPEYPTRAVLEHQEGSVTIRLDVGADGWVSWAEAIEPSRWPLLNASALRAVRDRWRFSPGPNRAYQVVIRFKLAS